MERHVSEPERAVLRLHGAGRPPHEIARELGMSETTVAWIVSRVVSEWGARRTEELALALAISQRRRLTAQIALPLLVMAVLAVATIAALAATGTLHGPLIAPTQRATASAAATSGTPSSDARPTATTSVAPAADAGVPTVAPTAPPAAPTLAPLVPTAVPTLPVPLPPLPTVPPLPTPHLPAPLPSLGAP